MAVAFTSMTFSISARAEQKEAVKTLDGEYAQTYDDILDQVCNIIDVIASTAPDYIMEEEPYIAGSTGILEKCKVAGPAETFNRIGYTVRDINADGVPELIIGEIAEREGASCHGHTLYAVYRQSGNRIYCVLEGMARDSFQLLDDISFFNQASEGAMYSMFGRYILPPHENATVCSDYYFTCEKDETFQEAGYYHNTSGQFDKAVSQQIAEAKYDAALASYVERVSTIQLIPLATHAARDGIRSASVFVQRFEVLDQHTPHDEFIADSTEAQVKIAFSSAVGVQNFKVLELALVGVDDNGKPTFSTRERYTLPSLKPERPLVLGMTFYGSIPHYGISFIDEKGEPKRFFIDQSGNDGSILLVAF